MTPLRTLTLLVLLPAALAAAEVVICPACGAESPTESAYCASCGAVLSADAQSAREAVVAVRVDTDRWWRIPDIKPGLTEVQPPRWPGSGFIVDEEGHVVTSAEFLAGWRMVWVRTADGQERPAAVVGVDLPTGVALLSIENPPPPVSWAPAGELAPNAPLHILGCSPELGLVDVPALATGRQVRSGFTQIERSHLLVGAVEPACWGGPVVDEEGRVVAMAVARPGPFSDSGRALGVPVEILHEVVAGLAAGGAIERPYLGLVVEGNPDGPGPVVRYILPGSPAEAAGLAKGDLLLALDGEPVEGPVALLGEVMEHRVGERLEMLIRRGERELTLGVVLAERPESPRLAALDALHFFLGLEAEPVPGGLAVTGVVPDSPADRLAYPLEMPKIYRVLAGARFDTGEDGELRDPAVLERAIDESRLERHFAIGLFWGPTRFEGKVFIVPLTLPPVI